MLATTHGVLCMLIAKSGNGIVLSLKEDASMFKLVLHSHCVKGQRHP